MISTAIKWKMFIFVKSAAKNIVKRANIRSTWGAVKYVDGGQFSTIFVIGKTKDVEKQHLIDLESQKYADIMQADVTENYL